jgi:sortase (surface protein transpeptidase)
MVNSSSIPGAIIYTGFICILVLAVFASPSLFFERAEASTEESAPTFTLPLPLIMVEILDLEPADGSEPLTLTNEALADPVATPVAAPAPAVKKAVAPTAPKASSSITPARLSIPSVGIDKRVVGVGVNAEGEIDVPSGETQHVGWYSPGVKPGGKGVAVMDAHVFAAFKNLSATQVGADIYVADGSGAELHFRVTKVATYQLSTLSPQTLFSGVGSSGRYLNLITCAGTFSTALDTYDHRLIVFAEFVS